MCRIFHQRFCLLPSDADEDRLALFDSKEELDFFQLRMGLDCLCQNTLFYPRYHNHTQSYHKAQSPYAEEFYYEECQIHCGNGAAAGPRDRILEAITWYFCENREDAFLNSMEDYHIQNRKFPFRKIPYDPTCPRQYYIQYVCPFQDKLMKFAFPVYVEDHAVAVLFTGQFTCGGEAQPNNTVPWKHHFSSPEEMDSFVRDCMLPIVMDFQKKAQTNLYQRRTRLLKDMMERCISEMEEEMTNYLLNMPERLLQGESEDDLLADFWEIVKKRLDTYSEEVGIKDLILFISADYAQSQSTDDMPGIRLMPSVQRLPTVIFKIPQILSAPGEQQRDGQRLLEHVRFDTSIQNGQEDTDLSQRRDSLLPLFYFPNERPNVPRDVVVHLETMQPFALSVRYRENSAVAKYPFANRKRVLRQLNQYFEKVAQELAYFSIRISDYTSKSVLRIYRHEITHQVAILQRNNWFLNPEKLRRTDDAKLRMVEEDQRQCINELDFMTQNIDVMTGRMRSRIEFIGNQEINVRTQLFNRIRSLYGRKAREKGFEIAPPRYDNQSDILRSRLELLDIIFFNLMNNAIKYGYSGTRILIEYADLPMTVWWERHKISFTDFGVAVGGEWEQEKIFKMHFRANTDKQIEGSGIGLYVAKSISELLNARLKPNQKELSQYNIPMLAVYHLRLQKGGSISGIDDEAAEAEYARLEGEKLISRVCNSSYLKEYMKLSEREIRGELLRPTYEVTFSLKVGD